MGSSVEGVLVVQSDRVHYRRFGGIKSQSANALQQSGSKSGGDDDG